jgi:peptidoglycan-N-acetylglucosamine deacetylase
MNKFCLFALFLSHLLSGFAQSNPWNGKKCAVVLTYDDALNTHVNNVLPALDSLNLKATFYISDYFGGLRAQIPKWREAAKKGHELGNHTIHHPCLSTKPGRQFVKPETDMNNYTVQRLVSEIKAMNTLLTAIDGKTKRTYAYPCGDAILHDTAYIDYLKDEFIAARGVYAKTPTIDSVDLYNVTCFPLDGHSGQQMIDAVNDAMNKKGLVVFLFHGVGGEHSLNVTLQDHRQLLRYLKKHEKEVWIAPLVDVADFIQSQKKINKKLQNTLNPS